jgi:multicomponent K+:H+ antiporter subunit D
MGTMMVAVAAFTPEATAAALYYLVHSTFAAAALFLLADLVLARRGRDGLQACQPTVQNGLFAALFFGGAIGMAGMPPLSGFLGKLVILDAMRDTPQMTPAFVAILLGSLLTIVGFARAGSILFWKSTGLEPGPADPKAEAVEEDGPRPAGAMAVAPTVAALALMGGLAIFAGPVSGYLGDAAGQLYDSSGYISAVMGQGTEG